jgi:magnesium chelatase family protein
MTPTEVRSSVQDQLEPAAAELLHVAVRQLNLSARAFHRVLKLSRTIADLAESLSVRATHLAEAVQYRERVE